MSEFENPYEAPESEVVIEDNLDEGVVLANRWTRLVSQIIDGLIMMAIGIPILFVTGVFNLSNPEAMQSITTSIITTFLFIVI